MEPILACRVCLSTEMKLYAANYQILNAFEELTGTKMAVIAEIPQLICSFCRELLLKSVSFKKKCDISQKLLSFTALQKGLTLNYVQSMSHNEYFALPLTLNAVELISTNDNDNMTSDGTGQGFMYVDATGSEGDKVTTMTMDQETMASVSIIDKALEPILMEQNEKGIEFVSKPLVTSSPKKSKVLIYKCEKCDLVFLNESSFRNHMICHDVSSQKVTAFQCNSCEFKFKSINALSNHTKLTRNGVCDQKWSPCMYCGNNFEPEDIEEHLDMHRAKKIKTGKARIDPDPDNKQEIKGITLRRYYEVPTGFVERRVKMNQAKITPPPPVVSTENYVCDSKGSLTVHKKSHTDDNTHVCGECGKTFSRELFLMIHMRTHTGEKSFQCPLCQKVFLSLSALYRHTTVHTGDRPYPCTICGKAFSQSTTLKKHTIKIHMKAQAEQVHSDENVGQE